ncbi:MAG: glycosyltransferase family 2 protein [Polaromonas sp.]|nr:glycosyltransferase family 2 protein [Polaromonas sp.]
MQISVLMPVYNGIPFISEAVESVLAQEFQDWELVISDNGSRDGTRQYLRTLSDPRIRIYEQPLNLGIMGNLNFLLAQARAPIAKLLGHDDLLLAGGLERTAQFMEERPNCAVSRCWALGDEKRYAKGGPLQWEGRLPSRLEPAAAVLAFATFGNLVGNICRAACRPNCVLQAGGFDQKYPSAGDYDAWHRVARTFGIELQNEELVFERIHALQDSNVLNQTNQIYAQVNSILETIAAEVDPSLVKVLKRHWTIHFFSQRSSRFVRQILRGHFSMAASALQDLPLGITAISSLAAYPISKLKLPQSEITTRYLFKKILNTNRVELVVAE